MANMKYLHPHTEVEVYDNTESTEQVTGGGTILFQPFLSEKGVDNEVVNIDNLAGFIDEFGDPNYKLYGQAGYNAERWLRGGGLLLGMRIMAENAVYSTSILNIQTRNVEEIVYEVDSEGNNVLDGEGNPTPIQINIGGDLVDKVIRRTEVRIVIEKAESGSMVASSEASIQTIMDSYPKNSTVSIDGEDLVFENHPLFALYPNGRGTFGNAYSFILTRNDSDLETYSYRTYNFSIAEVNSSGNTNVVDGPYVVSLYPDALGSGRVTKSFNEILVKYSSYINSLYNDSAYDSLVDTIIEGTKDQTTGVSPYESDPSGIDFIFGLDGEGDYYDDIIVINDSADVTSSSDTKLLGGSDGDFSTSNYHLVDSVLVQNDQEYVDSAIEQAYINAYLGVTDPSILNIKKENIDVVLDSNLSNSTKSAIKDLCNSREDTFGFIDLGLEIYNTASALAARTNGYNESVSYRTEVCSSPFVVEDSYTGKDIPVTYPMLLANQLPEHDDTYGKHYPLAGQKRGGVSGFKSCKFIPNEASERESLYKARINYFEKTGTLTYKATQITTQAKNSDLTRTNNVRTLMEIIRLVRNLADYYNQEFSDDDTIDAFNNELENILGEFVTVGACTICEGALEQTDYEKDNNTGRVEIQVAFTKLLERILIKINVGS